VFWRSCLRLVPPRALARFKSRVSGNSTDRPRASTVEVLSVVGPMAGSGTLQAVQAQHVDPVRVLLTRLCVLPLLAGVDCAVGAKFQEIDRGLEAMEEAAV